MAKDLVLYRTKHGGLSTTDAGSREQKKAARLLVQHLFFECGYSKKRIMRETGHARKFIDTWCRTPRPDPDLERRGWKSGQHRRYSAMTTDRVKAIHAELLADPHAFFHGASAIALRWRECYPDESIPSLRQIGRILTSEGLSRAPKRSSKGAARLLCYPETLLYEQITTRLLEVDFIGKKYLRGCATPLHFLGCSFKKAPRLRYFRRIDGQTTTELLDHLTQFFTQIEKPDAIKVDNALTMIGSGSGQRSLSKFMHTLLQQQITPIFAVPRKPFSQASIEGNNSVFSRKFWNRREFTDLADVDRQLAWFNHASEAYCGYQRPVTPTSAQQHRAWLPRVYFLRQVTENPTMPGRGHIHLLNESIALDPAWISYFVLAEWQPTEGRLLVWIEKEQLPVQILEQPFAQNPNNVFTL